MDIHTQTEIYLREAGYETWNWADSGTEATCFENQSVVGFIHEFESAQQLITEWQAREKKVLERHALALRSASDKAWNVYSVFLTGDQSQELRRPIEKLEENFTLTRKIARQGIVTVEDVENALMTLAPIRARPILESGDLEDRVRARSKSIRREALDGFLGSASPSEIFELLRGKS